MVKQKTHGMMQYSSSNFISVLSVISPCFDNDLISFSWHFSANHHPPHKHTTSLKQSDKEFWVVCRLSCVAARSFAFGGICFVRSSWQSDSIHFTTKSLLVGEVNPTIESVHRLKQPKNYQQTPPSPCC